MKHLSLKHSISKAQETYGWDTVTLTDTTTCKKYRTNGGGYDMVGTVFANWLKDNYSDELLKMCDEGLAGSYPNAANSLRTRNTDGFYGLSVYVVNGVLSYTLDGACGLDCIISIAKHIGLNIETVYSLDRKGRYKDKIGFNISVNE